MPLPPITTLLARLRSRLRWWLVLDGLSRLLAVVVGVVLVDLWLDWSLHMDQAQRAIMLVLAAAVFGAVAYRRLCQPLAVRPSDDALCLEIEDRHPELKQSLISAAQFARTGSEGGHVSPSMVRATMDLGARMVERVDVAAVLNRRRWLSSLALLIGSLAALGGLAAAGWANETMAIWFQRNVLLGEKEWPQDIHFLVRGAVDGVLHIPAGDDWPLDITLTDDSRRTPDDVWLEFRGSGERRRLEIEDGGRRFRGELTRVAETLEFRIVESRAHSDWIRVELVERPLITDLTLVVTPPAYTNAPAETLPAGSGPYKILQGSRLSLSGSASKPLSSAVLTVGNQQIRLNAKGQQFRGELAAEQVLDGDYALDVFDTEQIQVPGQSTPQPLAAREPLRFRLRLGPDRTPQVEAKLRGISTLVTPQAVIPIIGQAKDDFGITALRRQHRFRVEREETDASGTTPIKSAEPLPQPLAAFEDVWDLEPLMLPTGVSLSFFIEADDNNTVSGPGQGRSTVFLVRVVTPEELRAALLAREREQRADLEKRIKQLDELRTDTLALAATVKGTETLDAERRDQLSRLQRRQKSQGDDLSGIARKFEDLVVEIRQNRLEDEQGPLQTRIAERIVTPLWKAATDGVGAASQALERSRLQADLKAERDSQLAQAAVAQQKLLELLREILAQMEQAEGFQEAVNRLLEVQKAQQDVQKRTDQEKQDAIRKLLDGKPKKP